MAQYTKISRDVKFNHATSLLFMNISQTRSETLFLRLKDLESGFIASLSGLDGSAFSIFPLWLERWHSHGESGV